MFYFNSHCIGQDRLGDAKISENCLCPLYDSNALIKQIPLFDTALIIRNT